MKIIEMETKIIVFCMISLLAILVLGVDGCQQQKETAQNVQGIAMSFVASAPPETVSVNQEFPIYVDIINKGGSYINANEAKFYLGGIGYDLKNVEKFLTNTKLMSKESTFPERLVFAKDAKWTTSLENSIPLYPILLTGCYNYGTVAQVDICVSSKNESVICLISGEKIKSDSNSVAPLQITSVTESLEGNKLKVTILVENKGVSTVPNNPNVYLSDTNCDKIYAKDFDELQKENKVKVVINTGAEPGWTCKLQSKDPPFSAVTGLEGVISLEPVGKIVCEKVIKEETHVMPLIVSLQYRYMDSITKSIKINPAE